MPKAKKITFDPVAHLKTLPREFWLKVPTYNDKFSDPSLRTYDYDQNGRHFHKRPDACETFPEYGEFFDKYEDGGKFTYNTNYEDGKPRWDWVECVIGDFTFRRDGVPDRSTRKFSHPDVEHWQTCEGAWELRYGPEMDGNAVGYTPTEEGEKLHKAFERAEKKVASTWNSLRKKARRDAGIDLSTKDAVKAKAAEKAKKIKDETKLCADHIDAMIEALQEHKAKVLAGEITREETGYIFDMTNEMTARNAALRDALGNS